MGWKIKIKLSKLDSDTHMDSSGDPSLREGGEGGVNSQQMTRRQGFAKKKQQS